MNVDYIIPNNESCDIDDEETPKKRSSLSMTASVKGHTFSQSLSKMTSSNRMDSHRGQQSHSANRVMEPDYNYQYQAVNSSVNVEEVDDVRFMQNTPQSAMEADETPPPKHAHNFSRNSNTPYDAKAIVDASNRSSNMSY